VAVLYLGDGGGYEGMRQHVFDASWGVVGRGFYRAFIKRGAQVFYGQVYLQFLLKVMIPLGFAKGENSHFGFGFEPVLQGSYISRSGHGFVCFDGMAQF
jgi:hypothetical protein